MVDIDIKQAIQKTIHWFECVDRPVTVQELYENIWKVPCSFKIFEKNLFEMIDDKKLFIYKRKVVKNIKYVENFEKRKSLRDDYEKKERRIRRWLQHVPFVRGVYVVNSGAYKAWNEESDLDLLIVFRDGYMWLGRMLVTSIISLWGWRRHGNNIAKKICLSFFLTESAMDINALQKKEHVDVYLIYWLVWARPLIHHKNVRTMLHHNHWVRDYIPHIRRFKMDKVKKFSFFAKIIEGIFHYTGIGSLLNSLLRRWLKPRAEAKHKLSTDNASIIISDSILKFHEDDRREKYYKNWTTK